MMGAAIALCVSVAAFTGWSSLVSFSLYGTVFMLVVLSWLFGSLTVEIDDEELRHFFGPGFWRKSYLLQEIELADQVRNSWLYGWGIRLTPHGWLYNVSGLDAVQIKLRTGRIFRLGTDEPVALLSAIQNEINDP